MNTTPPTAQQIGAALERAARAIAPVIVAAYVAGYVAGAGCTARTTGWPMGSLRLRPHQHQHQRSSPGGSLITLPPIALQAGASSVLPICSASVAPPSVAGLLLWRDQ